MNLTTNITLRAPRLKKKKIDSKKSMKDSNLERQIRLLLELFRRNIMIEGKERMQLFFLTSVLEFKENKTACVS